MAFDTTLPVFTLEGALVQPVAIKASPESFRQGSPESFRQAETFRQGEGLALGFGALAFGCVGGLFAFFMFGRGAPWIPAAIGFAAYALALQLAAVSMRDIIQAHKRDAIVLFALHLVALFAWPIAFVMKAPASIELWLGLPALLTFVFFAAYARAPASVCYRSSVHLSLIAAIAIFEFSWVGLHG